MTKKVLLVNKFYYSRGGSEIVVMNLENELKGRGYDVAVFTMEYHSILRNDNVYTVSEVSTKGGILGKLKFGARTLGGGGIVASFKKVLEEYKPDIVHLHNIHSYISPVVARLSKEAGCRVVWTLHDYKLICPAYSCLNHGKVCELCFTDKRQILSNRCMKDSLSASVIAYIEAKKWSRENLEKWVDAFICPSQFLYDQMVKGGFSKKKLFAVCNFIDPIKIEEMSRRDCTVKEDYYTYIGRLSDEKGVETLLKVAQKLPYKLKIAGNGNLRDYFVANYKSDNIEFLGQLNAIEVSNLLEHAKLLVQPSEWYENNPLSIIEALCAGTTVIGANIGGIPELVNADNGLIFEPGNCDELAECIKKIMDSDKYDYAAIAETARKRFSAPVHFEQLERLYFGEK